MALLSLCCLDLVQAGLQVRALDAAITLLSSNKKDEAKVADHLDKQQKALRQEQALLQKHVALLQRQTAVREKAREKAEKSAAAEAAKQARLEQAAAKKAEKDRAAKEKEERAREKEEAKKAKEESKKAKEEKSKGVIAGVAPITKFFASAVKQTKPATTPTTDATGSGEGTRNTPLPVTGLGPQSHVGAVDVEAGSPCRVMLRSAAASSTDAVNVLSTLLSSGFKAGTVPPNAGHTATRLPVKGGVRGGSWNRMPIVPVGKRCKFLQFHDNIRPPFRGTFSKRPAPMRSMPTSSSSSSSARVYVLLSGRQPLAEDSSVFNYEVCVRVFRCCVCFSLFLSDNIACLRYFELRRWTVTKSGRMTQRVSALAVTLTAKTAKQTVKTTRMSWITAINSCARMTLWSTVTSKMRTWTWHPRL